MAGWRPDPPHAPTILLVVAENAETARLRERISTGDRTVIHVSSRAEAVQVLDGHQVDVLVTRLRAPRIQGLAILDLAHKRHPELGAILLIDAGQEEQATRAMTRGVFEFQGAPLNVEKIAIAVERILERQRLVEEVSRLSQRLDHKFGFPNLVGDSAALARLRSQLREIAPQDLRVLITGEEGTGKGLVAGIIHQNSPRRNAPFLRIDCGALPPRRLARILFGTPSSRRSRRTPGRIELAAEGTLYLEQAAALPLDLQGRVADVLRTGQLRPEIGAEPLEVRPRVLASSEGDLRDRVEAGHVQEGFLELISEMRVDLVPLRHRRRDIAPLARRLLGELAARREKALTFAPDALDCLAEHDWPGNIRELKGVMRELAERLPTGTAINKTHLPIEIREAQREEGRAGLPLGMPLAEVERQLIRETLRMCGGNRAKAAGILGIGVRTLYRKIKEMNASHG